MNVESSTASTKKGPVGITVQSDLAQSRQSLTTDRLEVCTRRYQYHAFSSVKHCHIFGNITTWNINITTWNINITAWNINITTWNINITTWNINITTWNINITTWNINITTWKKGIINISSFL